MPRKRTFFERLTGAVHDDDTDQADEREAELAEKEESLTEESEGGQLAIDVYQTADDIVIKTMVSGIRPEDLEVIITRDMVTIKGAREEAHEVSEEDYYHKELYWGSFSRNILLPQEIDTEMAEASEKHGMLVIRLPKLDKGRQTKLKVKSN